MTSVRRLERFSMLDWVTLDGDSQLLGLVIIVVVIILLSRIG